MPGIAKYASGRREWDASVTNRFEGGDVSMITVAQFEHLSKQVDSISEQLGKISTQLAVMDNIPELLDTLVTTTKEIKDVMTLLNKKH